MEKAIEEGKPPNSSWKKFIPWQDISEEQWYDWRWQIKNMIRKPEQLVKILPLPRKEFEDICRVSDSYPMLISPYYFSLIDLENPNDPIRKQSFPSIEELEDLAYAVEDPLDEEEDQSVPGLTHRYPDRVLLTLTNFCTTYCRHCTRKRIHGKSKGTLSSYCLDSVLDYLQKHEEIRDIVVSGGDPLALPNRILEKILKGLQDISHLEMIRIGTRVPVTLPMRLYDQDLLSLLENFENLWVNTHFNHPREITIEAVQAVRNLLKLGIPVNNQTVLLNGINDSVEIMRELMLSLLKIRVRPYYLFHCDPSKGVSHFRTSVWKGMEIIEGLRGHISGLGVPTYVIDAPRGGGKIPLMPNYVLSYSEDAIVLRNYEGMIVKYYPKGKPKDRIFHHNNYIGIIKLLEEDADALIPSETPRLKRRENNKSNYKK